MIHHVLVVCVGNVCRSPMATALLRQRLSCLDVCSAGIAPLIGHPADAHAMALMAARNIDISSHRASQLAAGMCVAASLILVMEAKHKHLVERRYPFARGKVFLLGGGGRQRYF